MARPEVPSGLQVKYHHERHVFKRGRRKGQIDPKRGATFAFLLQGDVLLAVGLAKVHHDDNFNKRLGRDVALGRALKNLNDQVDPALDPGYSAYLARVERMSKDLVGRGSEGQTFDSGITKKKIKGGKK